MSVKHDFDAWWDTLCGAKQNSLGDSKGGMREAFAAGQASKFVVAPLKWNDESTAQYTFYRSECRNYSYGTDTDGFVWLACGPTGGIVGKATEEAAKDAANHHNSKGSQ